MALQTSPREPSGIPKNPGRRELGMKATLLFPSKEIVEQYYVPLIYTACRTCYSELEPGEIFRRAENGEIEAARMQRLISNVIESGHGSTIEHVVFTFGISGVSRTLSHQLVRHRAGVAFDQQSQRYVTFKKAATMLPQTIADGDPGRGRALRLPECHAHQPGHDRQPPRPDPHVRAAAVHDGPVGDPPAVPADPPRDL